MIVHQKDAEKWNVTLINTGDNTMTGGRLKRVRDYLDKNEDFCFTYGDGVSDVDIKESINFHKNHKKLATVTGVQPPGRYGALDIDGEKVVGFTEKPAGDNGSINGGFFVLSPKVIDYIDGDDTSWEEGPLRSIAKDGELRVYNHSGFWHAMDTLRDKNILESLLEWAECSMEKMVERKISLPNSAFWKNKSSFNWSHRF